MAASDHVALMVACVVAGVCLQRLVRRRGSDTRAHAGLVGNTPLLELPSLSRQTGCRILAKLEFLNAGGSIKDRVAWRAVLDAERTGALRPGGTIVEGTSGSTGISLALVARARGYACELVVPDDMSPDKRRLLEALGARVHVVKPASIVNEEHYVNVARERARALSGAVFIDQFECAANMRAHYESTAPEIWAQAKGRVDAFVMSAGTGGTLAGVSRFLKQHNPRTRVVLADPHGSSLYNRVRHGVAYASEQAERTVRRHRYDTLVEGVGADRLTANFACALIDDAVRVSDDDAVAMAHRLLREEGLFVGSSSALNCVAAVRTAEALGPGHVVVTILCDGGQRYVTDNLYRIDASHAPGGGPRSSTTYTATAASSSAV